MRIMDLAWERSPWGMMKFIAKNLFRLKTPGKTLSSVSDPPTILTQDEAAQQIYESLLRGGVSKDLARERANNIAAGLAHTYVNDVK